MGQDNCFVFLPIPRSSSHGEAFRVQEVVLTGRLSASLTAGLVMVVFDATEEESSPAEVASSSQSKPPSEALVLFSF